MLPQVTQFEDTVILVGDTGIQFMDFALRLDPRKLPAGDFAPLTNGLLCRLEEGERNGMTSYFYESEPGKTVEARSTLNIGMDASLKLFDGLWLPLPVFRHRPRSALTKARSTGRGCAWYGWPSRTSMATPIA